MANWKDAANIWKNVREVDLRPIREEALREVKLGIVTLDPAAGTELADQLRQDPQKPLAQTHTPILVAGPEAKEDLAQADMLIFLVNPETGSQQPLKSQVHEWNSAGKKVLVFYNQPDSAAESNPNGLEILWDADKIVSGPLGDPLFLMTDFAPAVMELLPDDHLALARNLPLFRGPVAQKLINDTSLSNAAYALSTGIAEVVPVLDIPLNIADIVVLTKAQAFLVYRLGLALGFSTQWQDYITEFGSVIGGGFLWRQVARSLVGLIPVWGIVPKVAVAYAGTFVVGNVVLRWYLTGRHVSRQQIRDLYRQAFRRGKTIARNLLEMAPRPRLGKSKPGELPSESGGEKPESVPEYQVCPNCGRSSAGDAVYCQYCGHPLAERGD